MRRGARRRRGLGPRRRGGVCGAPARVGRARRLAATSDVEARAPATPGKGHRPAVRAAGPGGASARSSRSAVAARSDGRRCENGRVGGRGGRPSARSVVDAGRSTRPAHGGRRRGAVWRQRRPTRAKEIFFWLGPARGGGGGGRPRRRERVGVPAARGRSARAASGALKRGGACVRSARRALAAEARRCGARRMPEAARATGRQAGPVPKLVRYMGRGVPARTVQGPGFARGRPWRCGSFRVVVH